MTKRILSMCLALALVLSMIGAGNLTASAAEQTQTAGQRGKIINCNEWVRIRSGAGTNYAQAGYYYLGDEIVILEQKTVGAVTWGRTDKGWVSMYYVKLIEEPVQPEEPEEEGLTVTVTGTNVNMRSGPGSSYKSIGRTAAKGEKLTIVETTTNGSLLWGRFTEYGGGWIALKYTNYEQALEEENAQSGRIINCKQSINVRAGAGTNYSIVGSFKLGEEIKIFEQKTVGSATWGRTDKGWVSMYYVQLIEEPTEPTDPETEPTEPETEPTEPETEPTVPETEPTEPETEPTVPETEPTEPETEPTEPETEPTEPTEPETEPTEPEEEDGLTVTVTGTNVNMRSGPGSSYKSIGRTAAKDEKLTIVETATGGSLLWGRFTEYGGGWIALKYTNYEQALEEKDALPGRIINCSQSVNVRAGAGTGYAIVGSFKLGEEIKVIEQKTVGNTTWGRTGKGWVSMYYVELVQVPDEEEEPGLTSDACIALLKEYEGFNKYPYWDYAQYTVGYGSRCPDNKLSYYSKYGIPKRSIQVRHAANNPNCGDAALLAAVEVPGWHAASQTESRCQYQLGSSR